VDDRIAAPAERLGPGGKAAPRLRRIGHKGADALAPGNTIESFHAAVEAGVDVIELDVLRPRSDFDAGGDWRRAMAGPSESREPLLVAHDWGDAKRRTPLTIDEALDAFSASPLDGVEIDFDLKVAGREDELLAALHARGLLDRSMASTMETSSLCFLSEAEPSLRLGWTIPRIRRDWTAVKWSRPLVIAGLVSLRARLPGIVRRRAPSLGVSSVWAYHPVITRRLVAAAHAVGVELYAWTVDDLPRMRAFLDLGVDGICTNDPLLFGGLYGVSVA
jgi:glycerophosphoryl diester phosphodiesterase